MLNSLPTLFVTPPLSTWTPHIFFPNLCLASSHFMLPPWQDFLGQVYCTLGEIVGSPASRLEKPLGWVHFWFAQLCRNNKPHSKLEGVFLLYVSSQGDKLNSFNFANTSFQMLSDNENPVPPLSAFKCDIALLPDFTRTSKDEAVMNMSAFSSLLYHTLPWKIIPMCFDGNG